MKRTFLLITLGLLLGAGGTLALVKFTPLSHLLTMSMDSGHSMTADPAASPEKGKKVLYWKAPMDPTYIRKEPGKSPMGMDLIPVYEGEGGTSEPGTVTIDPVTVQNIGVKTEKAKRRTLTRTIRTVGRIDYNEKNVYRVHTKIEGWVEKLYVNFTGESVKKDDYLLEIYSPELVATQEEYLLAKRKVGKAGGNGFSQDTTTSIVKLSRRKLELWDVPDHQIQELDKKGKIIKAMHVHSPASGIVIEKNVEDGAFVKPGMALYTIADISNVWVYADIYEYEIPWVRVGQEAEMTINAYPGRTFSGKVSFIYPYMEAKTRTLKVRLEFENPKLELKPNMYANISLESVVEKESVSVSKEAVLLSGERSLVFVDRGKGKFMPRDVRVGVETGGFYQILSGVNEGETVVTSSHFLIDSESRLNEAISKMLEPKKEAEEEMDHSSMGHTGKGATMDMKMDHSKHGKDHEMPAEKMNHSGMDHKQMDHSQMDHSQKDEKTPSDSHKEHGDHEKKKEPISHGQMDHSSMGHPGKSAPMDMKMDHSKHGKDHEMPAEKMNHSGMDHKQMDHSQKHEKTPPDSHKGHGDHEKKKEPSHEKKDHSSMAGKGNHLIVAMMGHSKHGKDHKMPAEKMDNSGMDHSQMVPSQKDEKTPSDSHKGHGDHENKKEPMSRGQMDHSTMGHPGKSSTMDMEMDHSKHGKDHEMPAEKMDNSEMDHSQMVPSQKDEKTPPDSHKRHSDHEMKKEPMSHGQMDHSKHGKDHEMPAAKMDNPSMEHSGKH